MSKQRYDTSFTFRLSRDLLRDARARAKEREEDLSDIVRDALTRYVRRTTR